VTIPSNGLRLRPSKCLSRNDLELSSHLIEALKLLWMKQAQWAYLRMYFFYRRYKLTKLKSSGIFRSCRSVKINRRFGGTAPPSSGSTSKASKKPASRTNRLREGQDLCISVLGGGGICKPASLPCTWHWKGPNFRVSDSICFAYFSTLKIEAIYRPEASVDFYRTARRSVPEDRTFDI
jgi:hypothetical protein